MIKLKYPKFWSKKSCLSSILIPVSYIYMFLGYLRKKFTCQIKLSQTVICVGNITVGGSGKTQVVAWLARELTKKNISFVIVTKAYKSELTGAKIVDKSDTAKEVGDESVILRANGPVIAAKKLQHALALIEQIKPQVVILDDGMQNPLLYKDLQIVVFDSMTGVGNNLIFPAGPLRETLGSGLAKADLVFMIGDEREGYTNRHPGEAEHKSSLRGGVADAAISAGALGLPRFFQKLAMTLAQDDGSGLNSIPFFQAQIQFDEVFDQTLDYIAFAGIGNPDKFYSSLAKEKLKVKQHISFEDHHNYSDNDLTKLINLAEQNHCRLITTEKDYVKIPHKYKDLIVCTKVSLEFEKKEECINLIYEKILQKN